MNLFSRCSYVKCKTGLPGIVTPGVSFTMKDGPAYMPRGHAIINELKLCESCTLTAKAHEIVDDKRWADICRQIAAAGGAPPDRESLQIIYAMPKGEKLPPRLSAMLKELNCV